MRSERIDEVGRVEERGGLEAGLEPLRIVPGHVCHQRHVLDRLELSGGALHEELAVRVLDVFDSRFEQVRGDDLRFLLDLLDRAEERAAADGRRAASVGSPAHRRALRVAVHDLDVVHPDAELVGDDLSERRPFPLAVRRDSEHDVDLAGRVEADDRALPEAASEADGARDLRRPETADLGVVENPTPTYSPFFRSSAWFLRKAR
jgi:hypothetical protein